MYLAANKKSKNQNTTIMKNENKNVTYKVSCLTNNAISVLKINACVANGGWVLKGLGTETNNPNPGRWTTHKPAQPKTQSRAPPATPDPKTSTRHTEQ